MKSWLNNHNVRYPQYAGQFYPEDKNELSVILDEYFENAGKLNSIQNNTNMRLQALIVPHAGYVFSGQVAAAGFQQIPDGIAYERVFVLASSHRYSYDGAAVYLKGNYSTPFGEINVDTQLSKVLSQSSDLFIDHSDAHEFEHSLEVQLPFIQYKVGKNFNLVPIIIGTHNPDTCKQIADVLRPWFNTNNLWVISTDFSHYPEYNDACKADLLTANAICSNQPKQLLQVIKDNKKLNIGNLATSVCGWTSVLTLMYMTEYKDFKYEKILYRNSGDAKLYGSKNRVVGYWSIGVYENSKTFLITEAEKKELLEKAYNSIITYVKTGKRSVIMPLKSESILNEKMGVFVSIYIDGKLRGCIGSFAGNKTLNELVQQMAVSSSCDQRFDNISPEELDKMEVEISVLSPLRKIDSVSEIELGKHGIYIKKDFNTGTFLPQVATKTGWSLEEFLGHCSRDKAGIGWDGWKDADIFVYEALVFRKPV